MSDLLRDGLLVRVSTVMNEESAEGSVTPSGVDEHRADAVFTRVMESLRGSDRREPPKKSLRWTSRRFRGVRVIPVAVAAAAVVVLVSVLVTVVGSGGPLKSPITTSWQPGNGLSAVELGSTQHSRHGTWMLADDSQSGTWQQIAVGPPGGNLACPATTACYLMSTGFAGPVENDPVTSVSFYVSADVGATWTKFVMPSGFVPTTSLSCGGVTDCAAGGTYNGQTVLVTTSNGGHSFTVAPLPSTAGTLFSLSCPSTQYCAGLASVIGPESAIYHPNTLGNGRATDATFLSTDNGGGTFTDSAIAAGNSLWKLDCVSSIDCVALGDQGSGATPDEAQGTFETTLNGGTTWSADAMPSGLTIYSGSDLTCVDSLHCSVTGLIDVPFQNPPACSSLGYPTNFPTSVPDDAGVPSASLESIVQFESSLITAANLRAKRNTEGFGCSSPSDTRVSDIVSTTNAGATWTPEQIPANVPQPRISGLSCPTVSECWASGGDATVQQAPGGGSNANESVLLGTTDGGATWSKVTFNIPAGAPDFMGGEFLSIGDISCPSASVCAATGSGIASAPSDPFYSLAIQNSTS